MGLTGLVELDSKLPRETLEHLAIGAYHASKAGPVALLLTGLSTGDVDPLLDTVVRVDPREHAGVRYLAGIDADTVTLAASATFVVASSTTLRAALDARGVPWLDVTAGLRILLPLRASTPAPGSTGIRPRARGTFATR